MSQIERLPGMPTRVTLYRWAKAFPTYAAQLREARGEGQVLRRQADPFDAAVAEAFLVQVRRGRLVSLLVKQAGFPHREQLDRWLRQTPEFATAFGEAKRMGRDARGARRRPFDAVLADRMVFRVMQGEPLPRVMRDPAMPGPHVLRRWRRQNPEFDMALRDAHRAGHRQSARWRRRQRCTPELTDRIVERLRAGASLHGIGGTAGMPPWKTLYKWVSTRPDFAKAVAEACRVREAILLERAVQIVEAATPETLPMARRESAAVLQQLRQLSRHPGERRRDR